MSLLRRWVGGVSALSGRAVQELPARRPLCPALPSGVSAAGPALSLLCARAEHGSVAEVGAEQPRLSTGARSVLVRSHRAAPPLTYFCGGFSRRRDINHSFRKPKLHLSET